MSLVNHPQTYFISGHLDLSELEFNEHYRPQIDAALQQSGCFVVGDARGADALAQRYLLGKTSQVTVYHMFTSPRNNEGFITRGGFQSDNERDKQMTVNSTIDIAWVRPGREKSGTMRNLARRLKYSKQSDSKIT